MAPQIINLPSTGALPGIGGGPYAPGIYAVDYVARTVTFYSSSPIHQGEQLVTDRVNITYVVAASNASALAKAGADYLCTGTNDQVQIQNALNALPSGGGAIVLSEGLFSIAADVNVSSNASLFGVGRATILQAAAATQPNIFNCTGSAHILIANLTIDGNKANVTSLGIQYTHENGIYMNGGTDDVTIRDCWIHDCQVSGIMANGGSTNLMIANNRLYNNYDNQIYIRAQNTSPYTVCSYGTVVGNICNNGSFSGIQILGSSYFSITGNTCYSNGPTSGQGDGCGSEGASHCAFADNVCYNNGAQGINIRGTNEVGTTQSSSHIVVSGNIIYNHLGTGGDAGGVGISDVNDLEVSGNKLYNNYYGMNAAAVFGNGVNDLKIHGNHIKGSTAIGIRLNPGAGKTYEIDGNFIADTTNEGIHLFAKAWVHDNTIPRSGGNAGIESDTGSGGSVLEGNRCYDGSQNGIQIDNGVANVICRHNYYANVEVGTQGRGMQEVSGGGPTLLEDETFSNITFQPFNLTNAGSISRRSKLINGSASGFLDQNSGSATITATTSVAVSHGLWKTPTRVELTPTADPGSGIRYYVSAKTSTTFTITLSASSTVTFDWRAWTWDN